MKIRKALFSGSWYPASASNCEKEIQEFLNETGIKKIDDKNFTGGIVPHAGWYFSGSIACNVIKALSDSEEKPDVIVIFGMHLHENSRPYIMNSGAWETPFGPLRISDQLGKKLTNNFDFIIETHADFTQDNTIELQLPFIKYFFKDIKILPIGVPPSTLSVEIGKKIVKEAKQLGLKLKVIGSTDLTHYGPNYGFSPAGSGPDAVDWVKNENDTRIIQKILNMDPEGVINEALSNQNACCAGATAASLRSAKELGASKAEKIAYRTSNDKNPSSSFVGYTGILF